MLRVKHFFVDNKIHSCINRIILNQITRNMSTVSNVQRKYLKAKSVINDILCSHNLDELKNLALRYNQTKQEQYKSASSIYKKYMRNKRVVEAYEAEHEIHDQFEHKCQNCNRRQSQYLLNRYGEESEYSIDFRHCSSDEIRSRRSFKNVTRSTRAVVQYTLCSQCAEHLVSENNTTAKLCINTWPGFIWFLLKDEDIHSNYGSSIWRFIPSQWRYWWIDEAKACFPHIFNSVSIESPSPIFIDKTMEIKEWNDDVNSYLLPRLASSCNKHLMPNIMCPWGCSEFNHKCGHISMDIVFQRYLQRCLLKLIEKPAAFKYIISARDDYLRAEGDEDQWLFNPNWKVQPSIAFVDGCPRVLTCNNHNKGSNLFMIHPCRWKHNLPTERSDQLCHAVVKCRTIRPVQASTYSIGFQMHTQKGTFNGLDTCNVTSSGQFDKCLLLLFQAQARSIMNRPDINTLLHQLTNNGIVTNWTANGIREHATSYSNNIDYDLYSIGATYVPLESAMMLQREARDRTCIAFIDDRVTNDDGEPLPMTRVFFKKIWPSSIYPCQKMDSYGAMFVTVPSFNSKGAGCRIDTQMVWILSTLMTHVEPLWRLVSEVQLRKSRWHGWLLCYLTKKCFYFSRTQDRRDIFKFREVQTIDRIAQKIPRGELQDLLIDVNHVFCINLANGDDGDDLDERIQNEDDLNQNKIIIVFPVYSYDELNHTLIIDDIHFELRCVLSTWDIENNKWNAEMYSRHGNHFNSWWYQERHDYIPRQSNLPQSLPENRPYTLIYVRLEAIDISSHRNEFLKSLGGQFHVQCNEHRLPLIASFERSHKCQCGRKEHYRCSCLSCEVFLCKRCLDIHDENNITYIEPRVENNDDDDNGNGNGNDDDDYNGNDNDNDNDNDNVNDNDDDDHDDDHDDVLMEPRRDYDDDYIYNEEEDGTNHGQDDEFDVLERDDFDDFLTSTFDPDILLEEGLGNQLGDENDFDADIGFIPTSDAGEVFYEVEEETGYGGIFNEMQISGSVFMNQCGTLLTRKTHELKGSSLHKNFLQRICSTTLGTSIPLLYPEGMLFPSLHWKAAGDNCSLVGSIPAPLLTESIKQEGFASIQEHVRTRLTTPCSATSTDPRYISHCYDMMVNLSANHNDTRITMNRGLTTADDKYGGLGLRGKGDSALLDSIDSKQMVKNLCSSQQYHSWDWFLTFTCNQKKHFGTAPIKNWLDDKEWTKHYPDYEYLNLTEKKEIDDALLQASAGLLLRVWEEVSQLFIDYLLKSKSSPYKEIDAIFARKEYQKEKGNLSHTHLMAQVRWSKLTDEEKEFVEDLVRASIMDIVRSDEIDKFVDQGVFEYEEDVTSVYKDAEDFLPHRCNSRCLVKTASGFRCRKLDNLKASKDNTKNTFMDLPINYSTSCVERLVQIGVAEPIEVNSEGYQKPFKSNLSFFHPKRHIPPTNNTGDMNISPVEGYTFAVCRSMQNCQRLTHCGGCSKYVCKYIGKIDEQNYVVVGMNGKKSGSLISNAQFLHNTKVTSSKIQEDKDREKRRDSKNPQGRCISLMEMLHVMLKYPEVYTNLRFISISTMPLELRAGVQIDTDANDLEDGAYVGSISDHVRQSLGLPAWRQHTANELLMLDDLKLSKVSIDKISQFSLRPPEFRSTIDMVGHYYRWFYITTKTKIKDTVMESKLSVTLSESVWIDGLQRQVQVRKKALPEIMLWCNQIEMDDAEANAENELRNSNGQAMMIALFRRIHDVLQADVENLNNDDLSFLNHIESNLLYKYQDEEEHLPIPVYSYIKPTMGVQFLHHMLLSMGRFATEIDLTMHASIRDCLRYAKLIGPDNDDEASLQGYSNELFLNFLLNQMRYFPNSMRVIDYWIVTAGELFDSIIVRNVLSITDMPSVQLSSLLADMEISIVAYRQTIMADVVGAALLELDGAIETCNIPSKEALLETGDTVEWDPVSSFSKNDRQSDDSFEEQKLAILTCVNAIDSHCNILNQNVYTKNVAIRGFPGGGKTWCMMFIAIYAISKKLNVITTAMMAKRALQLGGRHWHKFLCIPTGQNLTPHRRAELAIIQLLRDPKRLDFVRTVNVMLCDEMGQVSAEFLATFDIILRRIRNNNIFCGGVLIICTMDHTQIQPIDGRPFLTSIHIIPCFKMVELESSMRASGDQPYQRIQQIARYNYSKFIRNPALIDEFITLCSNHFTFLDSWDHEAISPTTFRLYSRRVPAKEASKQFIDRVRRLITSNDLREKEAEDVAKGRYSHQEWSRANDVTSATLDQKLKEPTQILFFRGAMYECTYNEDGKFSQSQLAILFDLPSQDDLNNWRKIKVLVAPPGLKDFVFDHDASKESYLEQGFTDVKIGVAPQRTQSLANNLQAQRKQYGLKHRVAGTIHSAMGDTIPQMATSISKRDTNFRLWDKGQLIVIISRTREAKHTIFVGDKEDTLAALKDLLLRKTQWTDYMEQVLDLVTINTRTEERNQSRTMDQQHFPFRNCDITLPQCNTGYVYMLISVRTRDFTYIGTTANLRTRLQQHNTGNGSSSTEPSHLRPYALLAYICGFGGRRNLRLLVEERWKRRRDQEIANGNNDSREWARCGQDVINELNHSDYGMESNDLTLILLFR